MAEIAGKAKNCKVGMLAAGYKQGWVTITEVKKKKHPFGKHYDRYIITASNSKTKEFERDEEVKF